MNVLDLFSGIGGFSLGLERAGMTTRAFCESDAYCRAVLAKHWPGVPIYDDVRILTGERLRADGIVSDVITAGWPCQDISLAGRGAGLAGERSGLWRDVARIVGEVRPRYVILENVAALLARGMGDILGDLAALGFDAEWYCIPACAVGAPHRRDRIWIVAYTGCGLETEQRYAEAFDNRGTREAERPIKVGRSGGIGGVVANAKELVERRGLCADGSTEQWRRRSGDGGCEVAEPSRPRLALGPGTLAQWAHAATSGNGIWATEPDVGRVAHGVPARVDRLRALGNSLVPQIPELIGRAIMAAQ
jgi:DNA (cytosine-5)-methyltransferase 1